MPPHERRGTRQRAVGGRVSVELTCPKGCQGSAHLDVGRETIARVWSFHFETGSHTQLVFMLDARSRRILRQTGKLHATVSVLTYDLDGSARQLSAPVTVLG